MGLWLGPEKGREFGGKIGLWKGENRTNTGETTAFGTKKYLPSTGEQEAFQEKDSVRD